MFWVLTLSVFALDQASKHWVVERAVELRRHPIELIDWIDGPEAFLEITYVTNPGAAWSMFSDYPYALTVVAGIALLAIFVFREQLELRKARFQWVFGVICGGISGNLADRLFREPAEVVDFIDTYLPLVNYDYPVFNVADSALFLGAVSYGIIGFLESRQEKKLPRNEDGRNLDDSQSTGEKNN